MVPPSSRQTGRWRFSVAVLGPVAICLIATAAASLGFVLWSAHNEDQRALARQEALARHIIELQLDRIPHDQQSVTIWDDAVRHTKLHFDPQWIETNIGVWNVARQGLRKGSLDQHIRQEKPNDLDAFISEHKQLHTVAFNGKQAEKMYDRYFERRPGLRYLLLPGSSPANAAASFETLLESWKRILP